MNHNFIVVLGMLVLYMCSFFGLITAWVYYRKYKSNPVPKAGLMPPGGQKTDDKQGGTII
jgi:hypothetical protein